VRFRQGATEDGEVLRVHEYRPPVDPPEPGDHSVSEIALPVEAEVAGAVRDERVDLGEAAVVEQQVEALARRQLAPRVLLLDPCGSTALSRFLAHRLQSVQLVSGRHATLSLEWPKVGGPGRNRTCDRPVMSRLL
jgi:hypothetical protein